MIFDYWLNLVPHRPPYVVLCNFDEFWIYDFNTQLNEPVDRLPVADLPARHAALNFLFPRAFQPLFGHNWVQVTREAARDVAHAFNSLVARGEDRVRARRLNQRHLELYNRSTVDSPSSRCLATFQTVQKQVSPTSARDAR